MFKKSLGIIALVSSFASIYGAAVAPVTPPRGHAVMRPAPWVRPDEKCLLVRKKLERVVAHCRVEVTAKRIAKLRAGILILINHVQDFTRHSFSTNDEYTTYLGLCSACLIEFENFLHPVPMEVVMVELEHFFI